MLAAVELAEGTPKEEVLGAAPYQTPSGQTQAAILLEPIAITSDTLDLVIDFGLGEQGRGLPGGDREPARRLPVTEAERGRVRRAGRCAARPRGEERSMADRSSASRDVAGRYGHGVGIDAAPAGHARRAAGGLGGPRPAHRRPVPDPTQPLQSVTCRWRWSASWRPAWCWSSWRATSISRWARRSASSACSAPWSRPPWIGIDTPHAWWLTAW